MSKVIKFEPRSNKEPQRIRETERIWECLCGCAEFKLYENGEVSCWDCGTISNAIRCAPIRDFVK